MRSRKKKSSFSHSLRVFFGRGFAIKFSFVVLVIFIFVAAFAPLVAPHDPYEQDLLNQLASPSSTYLLGTDNLGRDILSRLIYGARITFVVSFFATTFAMVVGSILGMLAGYFGGKLEMVIMRLNDALLSIPPMVSALVLGAIFAKGMIGVSLIIGFSVIPTYCRMVYGQVASLRESDYILAAKLEGLNDIQVLFKHILPNAIPTILVVYTMNLGSSMTLEASMSYLGVGITAPTPTWGGMVSAGYSWIRMNPMLALLPGICIILVIVSFNIVGDSLRDTLDPRLRGKL